MCKRRKEPLRKGLSAQSNLAVMSAVIEKLVPTAAIERLMPMAAIERLVPKAEQRPASVTFVRHAHDVYRTQRHPTGVGRSLWWQQGTEAG